MQNHQHRRSGSRGGSLLRWAQRLLVFGGAAMLVWYALAVADAGIAQRVARRSLEAASYAATPKYTREPDGVAEVPGPAPLPQTGAAVAELVIPRVHLSAVVLHGSDARTLRRGPGHLENTPMPGESGNMVVAGHRDSFFRPLRDVQVGDDIFVGTQQGRFQYRVTSLQVVRPQDVSVLEPTDDATLTLITCYPFWVLGNAPDRFIVRATRVANPTAAALAIHATVPQASIPAPVVEEPGADKPVAMGTAIVHDDDTLVRQAIERFRSAYNARLFRDNEVLTRGMLRFETCDVTIADDQAGATCEATSQSPDDLGPPVWTVALERADAGWAIKSIDSR